MGDHNDYESTLHYRDGALLSGTQLQTDVPLLFDQLFLLRDCPRGSGLRGRLQVLRDAGRILFNPSRRPTSHELL